MQVGLSHIIGGFLVLLLIGGGAFTVGTKWAEPEANAVSVNEAVDTEEEKEATSTDEVLEEGEPQEELFDVVKVIDGDTITVKMNGKNETIRLIGIDTPETKDPRTGVQCFGKEATAKLKTVIGTKVAIVRDEREGERDKYDRLLAYIYNEEGLFLNKYLIEQGYAYEYTYDDPYIYQKEFKAAQADAKAKKRGLWAPDACPEPKKAAAPKVVPAAPEVKGAASTSAAAPTPQSQPQTQPVVPEVIPQPKEEPKKIEPEPASSSSYTCSTNKYNCTDFKTHAEAQAVFDQCGGADNDVHKLDNNKDGEACESLP